MQSERILELMARQMGGNASPEELLELKALLQQNPKYQFFEEILQSIRVEKTYQEPESSEEMLVHESWQLLQDELNNLPEEESLRSPNKTALVYKFSSRRWLQRAAIWGGIILLAASGFFVWKQTAPANKPLAVKEKRVAVPYGMPEKILLPDSSIVWLNAGSHIRYADQFIQQKREVYLEGEAFFSVHHDAAHPFIVHARSISVRAVGTAFNVQAYPDENRIETTLITGRVQITMAEKPEQRIILDPNEKLTVTIQENKSTVSHSKPSPKDFSFQVQDVAPMPAGIAVSEVAWMEDKLAFQNEPFRELAKRMGRRYNKQIIFRDNRLGTERLNGVFENENIEKALKLLQMTTPFSYHVQGDTVFLDRKN